MKTPPLFLALLLSSTAWAQNSEQSLHSIKKAYDDCVEQLSDEQIERGAFVACVAEAERQWNAELDRLVAADKRPTAKAEQAAWMKQHSATLATVKRDLEYYGMPVPADTLDDLRTLRIILVQQRVDYLTKVAAALNK